MKKYYLYIITLFGFVINIQAQVLQNSKWVFGDNNLLDFNVVDSFGQFNSEVISASGLFTVEGSASVSDANGNLLFFSDGVSLYRHTSSGNILVTNALKGTPTSTQNVIFIPKPGNSNIYYIVTINGHTSSFPGTASLGLFYSEYNFVTNTLTNLNTSLKDLSGVFINENYNSPEGNLSEALTSTLHSDGTNHWLVVNVSNNSNSRIFSYLITATGINLTPSNYIDIPVGSRKSNTLKVSKNSSRFALSTASITTGDKIYYGNFNNSNGQFSNLATINGYSYGLEFSNDSNILYYSLSEDLPADETGWRIYARNLVTANIITSNLLFINNLTGIYTYIEPFGFQTAVDGKIYISIGEFYNDSKKALIRISNNNNPVQPLNNQLEDQFLINFSRYGLPQLVNFQPNQLNNTSCQSLTLNSETNNLFVYDNYSNITTQTNYNLNVATQDITMKAADFVVLKPNTHIKANSKLWVKIQPCASAGKTSVSQVEFQNTKNHDAITNHEDLEVYPNPTDTEFNINSKDEIIKLTVFSLEGKLVFEKNYNDLKQITTNVSHLNKGLYFVTIYYKNGQQTIQKLIKK